ncbi:MAG: glycosyltransferase [Marmoricola sp.]|nr:glycosyltransferase [Marmoricola sp.]
MRVCLIASSRFPVREPFMGGMEAHTHALALELIARGHEVSVFAAPGSDPRLRARELRPSGRAHLELMVGLSQHTFGHFDVVHNNSLHHQAVAKSGLLDVPVLTTLHTPPVPWLESAAPLSAPDSAFVAVSDHVSQAWSHAVRSRTIHNGVDPALWGFGPGGARAVWSGRIVPEKAPHEAILACLLAGVGLDIAGPVHDRAYFETHVRPHLSESVRYRGHLGTTELRDLVRTSAVALVTPRWAEPFGLVAAEAMSCGTPVAGYDAGAMSEVVDTSSGRLAPEGDVEALARCIPEAMRLSRRAARSRVERHFSHARMVDAYESAYRELAAGRGL